MFIMRNQKCFEYAVLSKPHHDKIRMYRVDKDGNKQYGSAGFLYTNIYIEKIWKSYSSFATQG